MLKNKHLVLYVLMMFSLLTVMLSACLLGDDMQTRREKVGLEGDGRGNSNSGNNNSNDPGNRPGNDRPPVGPRIIITEHPESTHLTEGNISGTLSVTAKIEGGSGTLRYQWYEIIHEPVYTERRITGATNSVFTIPSTLTAGVYYYSCEIRADSIPHIERSIGARIDVSPRPVITINSQPAARTILAAGNIFGQFNTSADVTTWGLTVNYQWFVNTTASNVGGTPISNATNNFFTIPETLTTGVYYYFVEVTAAGALPVRSNVAMVFVGPSMVSVNNGTFELGRNLGTGGGDDVTPTSVWIGGFNISKFPITQALYQAVMGNNPSHFSDNPFPGEIQENRPVENVSWYDAIIFCNRLSLLLDLQPVYRIGTQTNPDLWGSVPTTSSDTAWNISVDNTANGFRLPTEAQWELAAKGGTWSAGFTYSGSNTASEVAWYLGNSDDMTHEVGKTIRNHLHIHDMSGNVREWCWDWFGPYETRTEGGQVVPMVPTSGTERVTRGGSWNSPALEVRNVSRHKIAPYTRSNEIGFRVVGPEHWQWQ
jgi:formylglycine-generating enzyme required for sulfatase activity